MLTARILTTISRDGAVGGYIKAIGDVGKKIRTYVLDEYSKMCTIPNEYVVNRNPYEVFDRITVPTSPGPRPVVYVVDLVDPSSNELLERLQSVILLVPGADAAPFPGKHIYILKTGGQLFVRDAATAYFHRSMYTIIHRPGELWVYDGGERKLYATGESAIVELAITIPKELAPTLSYFIDNDTVIPVLYKEPSLVPWVGSLAYIRKVLHEEYLKLVGADVEMKEDGSVVIKAKLYVDLISGHGFIPALIAVLAPLSVKALLSAKLALSVKTLLLIGGAIAAVTSFTILHVLPRITNRPSEFAEKAEDVYEKSKENIERYVGSLDSYLKKLLNEGKITIDDYNTIMKYVNDTKSEAYRSMEELKETVKMAERESYENGYKDGYEKAMSENMKWMAAAGGGGFIVGLLVGKR